MVKFQSLVALYLNFFCQFFRMTSSVENKLFSLTMVNRQFSPKEFKKNSGRKFR